MLKNEKKIIFFDGDGTLWYPKSTMQRKRPDWIYADNPKVEDYLHHLILTPSLLTTLKQLKKLDCFLVAISIHPHKRLEADIHMGVKMKHLKLDTLFDEFYTARPYVWGKAKVILSILKKKKIPKLQALLVGDSYKFDYLSARSIGVECLLIKTPYMRHPPRGSRVTKIIGSLKELPGIIKQASR